MPDTAPDMSEPDWPSPDRYPATRTDICNTLRASVKSMVEYEWSENAVYKNGADIEFRCAFMEHNNSLPNHSKWFE